MNEQKDDQPFRVLVVIGDNEQVYFLGPQDDEGLLRIMKTLNIKEMRSGFYHFEYFRN